MEESKTYIARPDLNIRKIISDIESLKENTQDTPRSVFPYIESFSNKSVSKSKGNSNLANTGEFLFTFESNTNRMNTAYSILRKSINETKKIQKQDLLPKFAWKLSLEMPRIRKTSEEKPIRLQNFNKKDSHSKRKFLPKISHTQRLSVDIPQVTPRSAHQKNNSIDVTSNNLKKVVLSKLKKNSFRIDAGFNTDEMFN